jgi:hypothetical protein
MSSSGTLAAIKGDCDVERDSIHPGRKLAAPIELAERSPKLEGNFLCKIFPRVSVFAIGVANLIEDLLVLLKPDLECCLEV